MGRVKPPRYSLNIKKEFMKIKILKVTTVKGQRAEVGDIIDATEQDAQTLVGLGKAEETNDNVKNVEPKENKAKGFK
tara:strand:- start:766 stop:996 length:231 start_codon:yes stop_codon:yes gene_type:complete